MYYYVNINFKAESNETINSIVTNICIISGSRYVLGPKGKTTCSEGDRVTNAGTCRDACRELNISFQENDIQSGYLCYKDARGKCYQNGLNGNGASLICKIDSEII